MTQANDLGAIQNQQGAFFRARNNANIQALATQHYGAAEPPVLYANMLWFSAGDGFIKIRNPTNTQWQNIGTIGPPLKWTTSVDLPQENFTTGDIKESYNPSQPTGWLHLSDGTIGNSSSGATSRANPDCWPLFNLLWSITSDDWCQLFVANVSTRSGRGTSPISDWNAQRHIMLPWHLGRTTAASGWGYGLSNFGQATWTGAEAVTLSEGHLPPHFHYTNPHSHWMPDHGHAYAVDTSSQSSWGSTGQGAFPTGSPSTVVGAYSGWPAGNDSTVIGAGGAGFTSNDGTSTTSWVGSGAAHSNIQPTTYLYRFIKL